jgi:hypothetical protein
MAGRYTGKGNEFYSYVSADYIYPFADLGFAVTLSREPQ